MTISPPRPCRTGVQGVLLPPGAQGFLGQRHPRPRHPGDAGKCTSVLLNSLSDVISSVIVSIPEKSPSDQAVRMAAPALAARAPGAFRGRARRPAGRATGLPARALVALLLQVWSRRLRWLSPWPPSPASASAALLPFPPCSFSSFSCPSFSFFASHVIVNRFNHFVVSQ